MTAPGISVPRLALLLAGLRWRSLAGRLRLGPRRGVTLVAGVFALLLPTAYVGLFATAFGVLGEHGGLAAQAAGLALTASAIAISSLAAKAAAGDLVMGTGGEIEFLLARPVGLPALVVARGLAGTLTDLFDALFLLPVLVAAALALQLPPAALAVAALASLLVQVAVTSLAQVAQIAVASLWPRRRRRLAWTLLALLAAAGMAGLWMAASTVLRVPAQAAQALAAQAGWLRFSPGGLAAAPLLALDRGDGSAVLGGLAVLAAAAAAALGAAWAAARLGGRRGWEQAGTPWSEAERAPPAARGRPPGLWRKDWLLITRDRPRLIALCGMPALFVGVQLFGSAGWGWSTGDPRRMALVAYSLAAYAATIGPLRHMESERRAFWLLLGTPISGLRLLASRAAFWAAFVAGLAAFTYALLVGLAGRQMGGLALVGWGAGAVGGAGLVAVLAVGMGAEAADLTDDRRSAIGLHIAYLFMLVAGLFNLVLLGAPGAGADARAITLYGVSAALAFVTGAERVGQAFDPGAGRRAPSPVTGAALAILLFLGGRAVTAAAAAMGSSQASLVDGVWVVLVGAGALLTWVRSARPSPRGRWPAALLVTAGTGLLAGAAIGITGGPVLPGLAVGLASLARALAGELVVRGLVQGGLHGTRTHVSPNRLAMAALISGCVAWAASPAPTTANGLIAAFAPAMAYALTGRLGSAVAVRLTVLFLSGH